MLNKVLTKILNTINIKRNMRLCNSLYAYKDALFEYIYQTFKETAHLYIVWTGRMRTLTLLYSQLYTLINPAVKNNLSLSLSACVLLVL